MSVAVEETFYCLTWVSRKNRKDSGLGSHNSTIRLAYQETLTLTLTLLAHANDQTFNTGREKAWTNVGRSPKSSSGRKGNI